MHNVDRAQASAQAAANGPPLEFLIPLAVQALLSSQALEHMLEACIAQGIEEDHEADLQELLVAALELSEETGADLASALRMLRRMAATSVDQPSHAQHLAQQVLFLVWIALHLRRSMGPLLVRKFTMEILADASYGKHNAQTA